MKKKRIQRAAGAVVLLFALCCTLTGNVFAGEENGKEPEHLYARSAVLMDADSGRILFAKNGQEAMPMASTTKIMTCILALENGNPEDVVTASANAAAQPQVRLGVTEGRQFFLRDLLYSLMLESHNDSAVMLAEHIGGDVKGFADMMNAKAAELHCRDTYFITPNGLDDRDEKGVHHTTAEDLAGIMKYCISDSPKQREFLEITRTEQYQFADCTNVYTYSCANHNAFLHMMKGALSGKTGFTNDAGYCYIGAVEQDGKKLIGALLACGWPNHKGYKWADMKAIINYGLEAFEYAEVLPEQTRFTLPVENGIPGDGRLSGKAEAEAELTAWKPFRLLIGQNQKIETQTALKDHLKAPVEKGTPIGCVRYVLDGKVLEEIPVRTVEQVGERTFLWCTKQTVKRLLL